MPKENKEIAQLVHSYHSHRQVYLHSLFFDNITNHPSDL